MPHSVTSALFANYPFTGLPTTMNGLKVDPSSVSKQKSIDYLEKNGHSFNNKKNA